MSAASELRKAIERAYSYKIMSVSPGSQFELKTECDVDAILDAVIASHPEYKLPDDGYGDDDSFNRGWNEGISEFLNFLQSAKTQKGVE